MDPVLLPHWSSRAASAARYAVGGGRLDLLIEPDQEPWSPESAGICGSRRSRLACSRDPSAAPSANTTTERVSSCERRNARRAVYAAVRPVRAPSPRARRPREHGGPVDDRLRGRAGAFGRDLHLRDLRTRCRPPPGADRDGRPPVGRSPITDEFAAETVGIDARDRTCMLRRGHPTPSRSTSTSTS